MSRRNSTGVGLAVAALSLAAYVLLRLELRPDFHEYAAGGAGFFPSPVGRLIGAGGTWPLVVCNAIAGGAVAAIACRRSSSSSRLWLAAPVAFWLLPAGVDALGCLAAACAICARSSSSSALGTGAAFLVHPASAIVPALELVRRAWRSALGLALCAGGLLGLLFVLVSPYRGLLAPHVSFWAVPVAAAVVALGLLPARSIGPRELELGIVLLVVVALVRSSDRGTSIAYARYALPLAFRSVVSS